MRNEKRERPPGAPGFHPRGASFRKLPTETRNKKRRKAADAPGLRPRGTCFRKLLTETRNEKGFFQPETGRDRARPLHKIPEKSPMGYTYILCPALQVGCFFWALQSFIRVGRVSASSRPKRGTKKRGTGGFFPRRNKKREKPPGAPGFHPRGTGFCKLHTETRNKKEGVRGILPPAVQRTCFLAEFMLQ